MPQLILAALVWIFIHLGLAGTTLRDAVVGRIGERRFRGVFSVLSILVLVFLVRSFSAAPTTLLWVAPDWLRWLLVLAMLPAFVLFVASVSRPNPTMIGSEGGSDSAAPRHHPGDAPSDAVVVRDLGGGAHHRQRRYRGDRVLRGVPGDRPGGHAVDRCQAGAPR